MLPGTRHWAACPAFSGPAASFPRPGCASGAVLVYCAAHPTDRPASCAAWPPIVGVCGALSGRGRNRTDGALHLICGLPCAGKTTLARQLEQEYGALRLNLDEWPTRLFGQDAEDAGHDARHAVIESLLWEMAARVLLLGVNVILDYGFWSRSEREEYRARAARLGASSELHYLPVPQDVLFERLATRNAQLPEGAFFIPAAKFQEYIPKFQPPLPEELARRE